MDLLRAKLKASGGLCGVLMDGGGGGDTNNKGAETKTENTDKRVAVQDGVGVSGDGNNSIVYNSSDAVVAIAGAGADIIKSSGGAVVELAKFQGQQNTDAWNTTIAESAKLVDKLIDKVSDGFALSSKAIDSFQPAENKNSDALKWAAIAAGVVGVAQLWGKK